MDAQGNQYQRKAKIFKLTSESELSCDRASMEENISLCLAISFRRTIENPASPKPKEICFRLLRKN